MPMRSGWNGSNSSSFFAGAHEFDGLAGDGLQAQGRAAARIAVQLGENRASDGQRLVKMRGDIDGFPWPVAAVEHKENFPAASRGFAQGARVPARAVRQSATAPAVCRKMSVLRLLALRKVERFAGDLQDVRLAAFQEHGYAELLAQRFELGPWPRDDTRPPRRAMGGGPCLSSSFGRACRTRWVLPRTMQADHHHAGGGCRIDQWRRWWNRAAR